MAKKQTHTKKGLKPPKKHLTKTHAKVYWPYLPLVLLLIGGLFVNVWQPLQVNKPATLAYASEMSRVSLLSGTNSQRNANERASLTINEKLNLSAQAKANDMVGRDYWAHNTPEGKEPWIFIDAQGYSYMKAGENLAYGFNDANATIIGWMNSPSHKANLLDSTFTEVGFGFANGPNFVGTGNETIVVAHYGKPAVATAAAPSTPNSKPQSKPATLAKEQTITQLPPPNVVQQENTEIEFKPVDSSLINLPVTTDNKVPENGEATRISIIQELTGGHAPWSALLLSVLAFLLVALWLFKHYKNVRKIFIEGEYFIAHHPALDILVVGVVAVAVYLSQSSGVVL